jgi:hypothetical protein
LCQFWVAIPDGSNFAIFVHTFKWSYEVLWMSRIKILSDRRRLGLSKIIFLFFIWPFIWEESLIKIGQLSHICRKSQFLEFNLKSFLWSDIRFYFCFIIYRSKIARKYSNERCELNEKIFNFWSPNLTYVSLR